MKGIVRISVGLMTMITLISVSYVAYKVGYGDGKSYARKYSIAKIPLQYGITKNYVAEKMEAEPENWYTPDELGIVLVKSERFEHYNIFIAREYEEKALTWMQDGEFTPRAIKYGNEFLGIYFLWVTPGLPESVNLLLIQMSTVLGIGWIVIVLIFRNSVQKLSGART
ncbi:MAG: hypothetical protein OEZ35_02295 [Candidatus Bathyarchaeota archaeon]|nr:hypothetical protein [Candidatus Bathyarchaeota archaeon]